MLNKDVFKQGIDKLIIEFREKNFNMTKERAAQWYSYMSHWDEEKFNYAIDTCLEECSYSPAMADVMKAAAGMKREQVILE